jgi:AAA domain/Bifunctional DNA primase/polymerase, N-terminal
MDPTALRHQLLAAGFCPLPLRGKKPFQEHWQKRTEPSRGDIDNWWLHWPDAVNTGLLTRLMPTLDIDVLNPEAAEAIENLVRERFEERGYILVRFGKAPKRAIPFRTNTPFAKITGKINAPNGSTEQKLELLCEGQQIVCDGIHPETRQRYSWHGGAPGAIKLEDLPYISEDEAHQLIVDAVVLLTRCFGYSAPQTKQKTSGNGFDRERTDWAAEVTSILAGRELHDSITALAAKLISSGMSDGAAVNFLRDLLQSSDTPPGPRLDQRLAEIPRAVASAAGKYSPAGVQHVPWSIPVMTWREPATIPRRRFLYGHSYARGFVSATVADGGVGKSILKTSEILSLATQLPLLGITPVERVRVMYWSGDDPRDEVERRISAACEHHKIDAKKLVEERWLFVGTRDEQPLTIGEIERGKIVINQRAVDEICAFIAANDIGFAVFDPFKATHRIPENDNTNMDAVAETFSLIAVRTNAAIGLDHHIRKPAVGQGEVTIADARGASALVNKVRLSRVCNVMTVPLAEQARISEEQRRLYFRVDTGKTNIAPPGKASWFKLVPVLCANGQETPIVLPWKFPGAFDAITPEHMHRVRTKAREGRYRKDSRSDDWIGLAVADIVGLDPDDGADLKQIKEVLKAWFRNGVLTTEEREERTA